MLLVGINISWLCFKGFLRKPSYGTGFGAALNIETLVAAAEGKDTPTEVIFHVTCICFCTPCPQHMHKHKVTCRCFFGSIVGSFLLCF